MGNSPHTLTIELIRSVAILSCCCCVVVVVIVGAATFRRAARAPLEVMLFPSY